MGDCFSSNFKFTANLFRLSKQYFEIVMHVRNTGLFKEGNQKLERVVEQYLDQNLGNMKTSDMDLWAVDAAHKLHPLDYGTPKVTKQYLLKACWRQDQFCQKLDIKNLQFQTCLDGYMRFLKLVKSRAGTGKITVPTLFEDFIWHSHMRDHEAYKADTKMILGFVLNHDDEIPKEKLKEYWDDALNKREEICGKKFEKYVISTKETQIAEKKEVNPEKQSKTETKVENNLKQIAAQQKKLEPIAETMEQVGTQRGLNLPNPIEGKHISLQIEPEGEMKSVPKCSLFETCLKVNI